MPGEGKSVQIMILHVVTNYTANAGAEVMLSRLLRRSPGPAMVASLIEVSDRYRSLAGGSVRFTPLRIRSAPGALPAIVKLAQLIAREKPDAILCWMYHAMVAGVLAQRLSRHPAPVFWNVRQSLDDPEALSRSTRLALSAARWLSRLPAGIIFNSARSLELHRRFGFRNDNVQVIPNGFDPVPARPEIDRPPRVFGIAARFHRQKDHSTFFRAAALVRERSPAARFVAVGQGLHESNAAVRRMIATLGLPESAIELRGEVTDMDAFYRAIDVLVLSSRTEGFPNVVAEAMSYGRPVITTDVGDAAAVVGDTGLVVPPGDAEALAEAMGRMLEIDFSDYVALAAAARRRVDQHYSLEQIADRYSAFLGCS